MRQSLTNDTRLIDVKALAAPAGLPGSNTAHCVNAGVWQAAQGAIQLRDHAISSAPTDAHGRYRA